MRSALVLALIVSTGIASFAGGPMIVGGPSVNGKPAFGLDGKPFRWNPASMPIHYRVDPGNLSSTVTNAPALKRVEAMFNNWHNVSTANLSFVNDGVPSPSGAYTGGDVTTVAQYNALMGSCDNGAQSPIVFDANGALTAALGLPTTVIGFASACALDTQTGFIKSAQLVLNGKFQDGITTSNNPELNADEFDEVITHEIGHWLGLDHSQINVDTFSYNNFGNCPLDELDGLPLMYPLSVCQSRLSAGLNELSLDDRVWISTLYPSNSFATSYAKISGTIYFHDGVSQVGGANVIVRVADDPKTTVDESKRFAVSVVSGFLFTSSVGQNVTGDNNNGSFAGSRDPQLIGYYEVYVPPGSYTVEVESINEGFTDGSSVGPFSPPLQLPASGEYWNSDETGYDFDKQRDVLTVGAGDNITGIDIILNDQFQRFDQFEDGSALLLPFFPSTEKAVL